MFTFREPKPRFNRRNFLKVGTLGLSLPHFIQAEAVSKAKEGGGRARAKSCIFLFLWGGPSHIDTWDMKPHAPAEIRGEFKPIATTVPGTFVCEHLPRIARLASHFTIVRTLHHDTPFHGAAGGSMLMGTEVARNRGMDPVLKPDDSPGLASLVAALSPSDTGMFGSVMLSTRLVDNGPLLGQTGTWLGPAYDPLRISQDPNSPSFRVDTLELSEEDFSGGRLKGRQQLLATLDGRLSGAEHSMARYQHRALNLLSSAACRSVFDISAEPDRVRDRYGRNSFGQRCLLARRLIEAGSRMVTVPDAGPAGGFAAEMGWDTHGKNFPKLKQTLLPRVDQAYSALLEDLLGRGMLEDTVVYLGGEFGRTPRIGQATTNGGNPDGRDHWPNCFSGLLAGGLSRAGMTYGLSDSRGAYPSQDALGLDDLAATILAAMGLDPGSTVYTRDRQPKRASHGNPNTALLE